VGVATNEHVLTKDTDTGNAIWKEAAGGGGGVDTSGTPVANDFARFTDADTIEGRSYAETLSDLSGQAAAAFDLNGQDLTNGGVLFLTEQASAEADVAGKGQYWVKTATPNEPWFTADTGTYEFQIGGIDYRSDISAFDISHTSLTMNNNWYDLDLSGIVPAGTRVVNLRVTYKDGTVGAYIEFRKNGYSNAATASPFGVLVANVYHYGNAWVPCDTSQVIEYRLSEAFTECYFTVIAWMF